MRVTCINPWSRCKKVCSSTSIAWKWQSPRQKKHYLIWRLPESLVYDFLVAPEIFPCHSWDRECCAVNCCSTIDVATHSSVIWHYVDLLLHIWVACNTVICVSKEDSVFGILLDIWNIIIKIYTTIILPVVFVWVWNLVSHINPLNAELNPIRHLLALVGVRHIVHVSRIRVKERTQIERVFGLKRD